jgi:Lrp/AsnC family transcriptional regulator, leucine-responsive regulatory protein
MNANNKLDHIDNKILDILQKNGRITNAELAKRIGMSPPPMLERVRKLEKKGIIRKYVALIDPDAVGKGTIAFVAVSLDRHLIKSIGQFTRSIERLPEVMECYHITGEDDYLLKVAVRDIHEYEDFILKKLTKFPALSKIKTSFVLSTIKHETKLPVE